MPSASCPPPALHGGLHSNHKTCRQPVPSNPGLVDTLQDTKDALFLTEDRYPFLALPTPRVASSRNSQY